MASTPRISIVTVCYNMANYVEQTIQSVVSQNYPNLEYIVVDGGSTDGTADIIDRYSDKINVAISEPDDGQYHAIQKGFEKSNGDIMAWLNADDIYHPWTFSIVGEVFRKFPDVDWIVGLPTYINKSGQCINVASSAQAYPQEFIRNCWSRDVLGPFLQQESMFWRKSLWDKVGGLNLKYTDAADYELWSRFARYAEPVALTVPLAAFRYLPGEQRCSVLRHKREEEETEFCSKLKTPPRLWSMIAKRGVLYRCLCRLLIWRKCRVIAYCQKRNEWVIRTVWQSISQSSLQKLLIDRAIAKETNKISTSIT